MQEFFLKKKREKWAVSEGEPSFCFSQGSKRNKHRKTQLAMLLLLVSEGFSCLTVLCLGENMESWALRGALTETVGVYSTLWLNESDLFVFLKLSHLELGIYNGAICSFSTWKQELEHFLWILTVIHIYIYIYKQKWTFFSVCVVL